MRPNRARSIFPERLDALVDPDYLNTQVAEICGDQVTRYFPGLNCVEQAFDSWGRAV